MIIDKKMKAEVYFMNGLLPRQHLHGLLDTKAPSMRWDGKTYLPEWQKSARAKLAELLGLNEIAKYAVKPEIEIEYDRYAEDLDCREIRFRVATEENVNVPCHLCIPKDAKGKLPVVITLQGHAKGMHISLSRPKFPGDEETCHGGDRDFVARALKEGICGIAMEQRCFGENGGNPDNSNPDCREPAMRAILLGRTLIGERVWDISRTIDLLSAFPECDTDRIVITGNSGGGTASYYAACIDERIKICAPSCAFCPYPESVLRYYHCSCNYIPNAYRWFDMQDLSCLIAPRRLAIVSGKYDTCFPIKGVNRGFETVKRIYEKAGTADLCSLTVNEHQHWWCEDTMWRVVSEELEKLG